MKKVLLSLQEVKKNYPLPKGAFREALKGVCFDIYEGEVFSLLGVNGAGKSTLSSIIAALHPCSSGDLLFKGISIYKDIIAYKKQVGLCNQKPNLDKRITLEENLFYAGISFGLSDAASKERLKVLMQEFDLEGRAGEKIFSLSGGYKQRFMIARTLMHSPSLVILDEPTVGLDPHIRQELWKKIRALKKMGVTVILTTHYLDEAEAISDRVCFIDAGSVQMINTPAKLKEEFKKNNLEEVFLHLMEEKNGV